jgi:hypothetical protein
MLACFIIQDFSKTKTKQPCYHQPLTSSGKILVLGRSQVPGGEIFSDSNADMKAQMVTLVTNLSLIFLKVIDSLCSFSRQISTKNASLKNDDLLLFLQIKMVFQEGSSCLAQNSHLTPKLSP